jgi:hypothetical protein
MVGVQRTVTMQFLVDWFTDYGLSLQSALEETSYNIPHDHHLHLFAAARLILALPLLALILLVVNEV